MTHTFMFSSYIEIDRIELGKLFVIRRPYIHGEIREQSLQKMTKLSVLVHMNSVL